MKREDSLIRRRKVVSKCAFPPIFEQRQKSPINGINGATAGLTREPKQPKNTTQELMELSSEYRSVRSSSESMNIKVTSK